MHLKESAEMLRRAVESRTAIQPLSNENPSLSLTDAYSIQGIGLEMAIADGKRLCGYKMGLTSRAKQRDVNVFEPIRGYLLSDMEVEKGGTLDTSMRIHPRVEPEVAVVLREPLWGPDVSLRQVQASLALVVPALEILDSRFEAFSFKLPDVVADNTSASGFVLGRDNLIDRLSELSLLGVTVKKNGVILETGAPAAVLGDPLLSVVALAKLLAKEGKRIEPGMVILTGGITASVSFSKGDFIEVVWPGETLTFRAV